MAMRRLFLLLLGLMAIGTMTPAIAATPPRMGTDATAMAMPAGHCPDMTPGAAHACLGCAVQPEAMPSPRAGPSSAPPPYRLATVTARPSHPTGFDPPPPRG